MATFFAQFQQEFRSRISLTVWALLTSFLSLIGPFGSGETLGLITRSLFWGVVMGGTILGGAAARALVAVTFSAQSVRLRALAIAALLSLVLSPVLWLFSLPMARISGTVVPDLGQVALLVASVSLGISSLRQAVAPELPVSEQRVTDAALAPSIAEPIEPEPMPEPPRVPRLLHRLEQPEPGALWSISVRDHYVDVQTSAGVASLLMRLSDAMAETDPVEGTQIHRSHWVAWEALQGIERDGVKLFVVLLNGARLPVSKNHRDKLAARGLL